MLSHLEVGGVVYRPGDRLKSKGAAETLNICARDTEVKIVCIKNQTKEGPLIGVQNGKKLDGWHDLDGRVPHGRGLWLTRATLNACFKKLKSVFKVSGPFIHKKHDLNGMNFRYLAKTEDNMVLAEMEENIDGSGGDGLGKAGHCVLLPAKLAKRVKKE